MMYTLDDLLRETDEAIAAYDRAAARGRAWVREAKRHLGMP
ncbi:MAG TPA: hypothetical protein VI997_11105 [Candidatus Thermoplasmatota archaeon]|nr:hypothetical protein [Candidatus Thermoplasmatota archaeon]